MILRTGNNHSSSHSLSPKRMKNNKGGIKDERKLRDDSGIVDIDKRSGVRDSGWHATCTVNS